MRQVGRHLSRTEFLTHCRPADPIEYAAWLIGYIASGGKVSHEFNFPLRQPRPLQHLGVHTFHESGIKLPRLCGGKSVKLLVPAGVQVDWKPGELGHSSVYFMDGYRFHGLIVPSYTDVRAVMMGLTSY